MVSRIQKIATKQGHPIPKSLGYAQGPFPPELYRSLPVIEEYEPETGNGGPEIPEGGTAQNGFREHSLKQMLFQKLPLLPKKKLLLYFFKYFYKSIFPFVR